MQAQAETITLTKMFSLGLMFPVFSGIQIDLNAVSQTMPDGARREASVCDHNCTGDVGGYTCPAAFTLNKGVKAKFASGERLLSRIETGRSGLMLTRDAFLKLHFGDYCSKFNIPPEVQALLRDSLDTDLCEVNLFGGDPEMHPEVIWLIRELKQRGFRVNLTTTGRRFITSPDFVEGFTADPPHLLALSADDFDAEQLDELFQMPLADLRGVWKKINPLHGQAQKFVEGIYAARRVRELGIKTTILFNMVLHKGNLRNVYRIMDAIREHLPGALVNPYPGQDSFEGGNGDLFLGPDLQMFSELVDFFIAETLNQNPGLTKRIQYWLVMRAVLNNCPGTPLAASRFISGHGIWQCYRDGIAPGAGMYLQIGKGNRSLVDIGEKNGDVDPGGHAGCYWENTTVTSPRQVDSAAHVAQHLLGGGMQELARRASSPCPGCSMPRLWFTMITTELGLHTGLHEEYLRLRQRHVGF